MAHLLLDITGIDSSIPIGDAKFLETMLFDVAQRTKATILNYMVHQFEPHGATAILLLAESHLSAHSWPEKRELHIDYYHCGGSDEQIRERLESAAELVRHWVPASHYKQTILPR